MTLHQWAIRWGVPFEAVADLQRIFGQDAAHIPTGKTSAGGEDGASVAVRLEAPRKGVLLWRNNVGAMQDASGRVVRYGLCNDSKALSEKFKSGDLIGIRKVIVTQAMVGLPIGQFVSREVKAPFDDKGNPWRYSATPREVAQLAWAQLIVANGGDAAFCTGEGSL